MTNATRRAPPTVTSLTTVLTRRPLLVPVAAACRCCRAPFLLPRPPLRRRRPCVCASVRSAPLSRPVLRLQYHVNGTTISLANDSWRYCMSGDAPPYHSAHLKEPSLTPLVFFYNQVRKRQKSTYSTPPLTAAHASCGVIRHSSPRTCTGSRTSRVLDLCTHACAPVRAGVGGVSRDRGSDFSARCDLVAIFARSAWLSLLFPLARRPCALFFLSSSTTFFSSFSPRRKKCSPRAWQPRAACWPTW
jgi:hypothetical protein